MILKIESNLFEYCGNDTDILIHDYLSECIKVDQTMHGRERHYKVQ